MSRGHFSSLLPFHEGPWPPQEGDRTVGLLAWEIGSLHLGQTRVNPISSSGGGTEKVWALGVGQQPAGSRTRGSGKCGPALPNQQGTSSHSLGSSEGGGSSVCLLGGAGTAPAWSTGQGRWSTSAPWCLRCACLARCLERRRTELPSCSCACRLSSWWPLCAGWSLRMTLGGGSGGWTPGEGGHAEPQRVG